MFLDSHCYYLLSCAALVFLTQECIICNSNFDNHYFQPIKKTDEWTKPRKILQFVTRLHFTRDTCICPLAQLYTFTTYMLNFICYFMKSMLLWDTGLFTYHLPWTAGPPCRQQGQNSYFCLEDRHPNITWITEDSISPIIQDLWHTVQLEWLYLILGNMTRT